MLVNEKTCVQREVQILFAGPISKYLHGQLVIEK